MVAYLSEECFTAAYATRWACSPSPHRSAAMSCVRSAFAGDLRRIDGSSDFYACPPRVAFGIGRTSWSCVQRFGYPGATLEMRRPFIHTPGAGTDANAGPDRRRRLC
ncbi:MAG: hypothetical protein M3018_12085, partial [Actinomycetota bacterium]|nr:hypothetical protein [Actinomycetota bacterium]